MTSGYTLSVNYEMSIEEAVALGRYDWANRNVTSENFWVKRTGKADLTIELVRFNRMIGTDAAFRELNKMGYRPAELHELLVFGEKYPDVQREFPVVALGSVWQDRHGNRRVPYLDGDGSERHLHLDWLARVWDDPCWFAAVRK